jgi:hypothetical protein
MTDKNTYRHHGPRQQRERRKMPGDEGPGLGGAGMSAPSSSSRPEIPRFRLGTPCSTPPVLLGSVAQTVFRKEVR